MIEEEQINIMGLDSKFEGRLTVSGVTRFYGELSGDILGGKSSHLAIMEGAQVIGNVQADDVFVSGYVKGKIQAQKTISLGPTARVYGDLNSPEIKIDIGALLEGHCQTS